MKNQENNSIRVFHYDPVCRRKINKNKAFFVYIYGNEHYLLCCPVCQSKFEKDTKGYMEEAKRLDTKTNKQRA